LTVIRVSEASERGDTRRARWANMAAMVTLVAFHAANNWAFVAAQVTILGWDRPAHLVRTLIYNEMLAQVNLRSLFEVLTWSWNRPPLYHLVAVPFYRLFGVSTDVALMTNVIFVAILPLSVYGIGRRFYGEGVGLFAAFLVSTYPILFSISRMPYVDYSLTAMVALAVYLLVACEGFRHRGRSLWLGLVIGLGILTKWPFVAFAGGPIAYVAVRSGALRDVKATLTTGMEMLPGWQRFWRSPLFHAAAGLVVALLWYWPNLERLEGFALGYWLMPISWLLVSLTLFALSRPAGQGAYLLSAMLIGATVGSVWSLPNLRFSERFLTVVYSGLNMEGTGLGPLSPSFYVRYLGYLPYEQLSPLYFSVLVIAVALLLYSRWRKTGISSLLRGVSQSTWILMLWFVVSMLIFTFSLTMNSRFDVALLPPLALLSARGLYEIKPVLARHVVVAAVVFLGLVQFFALSYDGLDWLREGARLTLPGLGAVNLLAEGSYVELPSSGRTDSRYFVAPLVLDMVEEQRVRDGRDSVQLGNLINRSYSNNAIFQYLMYDAYPGITLREFARDGWEEAPFYERLFECDFLLMKSDPLPGLREHGLEAMEIIESGPSLFEESFEVVWEHSLPDGDTVYLYEKRYHLRGEYAETDFRAAATEIESLARDGDGMILVPGAQVEVLGRYYTGDVPAYPVAVGALVDEEALGQELATIVAAHERVFLVVWAGDNTEAAAFVSGWLGNQSLRISESEHGEVHVLLYGSTTG
jgi:4-amino-4-deoxy-L-arabinose transferase-like glycosyltransferase